jgi:hypothetical protein
MKKLMLFFKLCLFHEKLSHCTVPGAIAAGSTFYLHSKRGAFVGAEATACRASSYLRDPGTREMRLALFLSLCEMLLED